MDRLWLLLRKPLTAPTPEARNLKIENIGLVFEAHPGAWKRTLTLLSHSLAWMAADLTQAATTPSQIQIDEQCTVDLVSSMSL